MEQSLGGVPPPVLAILKQWDQKGRVGLLGDPGLDSLLTSKLKLGSQQANPSLLEAKHCEA